MHLGRWGGSMQELLAKYGKLTLLSDDEIAGFRGLASAKHHYAAGRTLVASDYGESDQLYIVEKGRLFASIDLPSGERAITRLYFSGDIVGTANMPFERATQNITVSEPSTLYVFPRSNLGKAFVRLPRIAAIFYTFAAMENAILNDRLVSIGRTRGRVRLASLILEISARQHLSDGLPHDKIKLGMTQSQIGDAIGLTPVQVNRLLRELAEDGLITRSKDEIAVLDMDRLAEVGHFRNRYEDLDLDWFIDAI